MSTDFQNPRASARGAVNEVSGQKPAGYDHLGHALRTVRHSGEGWR